MLSTAELTKNTGRVMPPELWGYPGWLSPSEVTALEQLRARVVAEGLFHPEHVMEDKHLLRFLRARQFDVEKTFKMLAADLDWRREFENRLIRGEEAPSVVGFCNNGFLYRAGYDKDGRPVLVLRFAYAFPRQIKDMTEIVLFWVAYVHLLTEECEKHGVTDYTVIADLSNFSPTKNFSLAIVKVLLSILQNNYPERLAYALILNLPAAFRMGWNLILPFLDERTKAKIHILGPNLKLLQDYIPASELEVEYGGKHEAYPRPDRSTQQIVKQGMVIKTGYYETSTTRAEAVTSVVDSKEAGLGTRTLSSSRLDRIRQMLSRQTSSQKGDVVADAPKAIEVPKNAPRVAIFGATGRTGVEVVKRFLETTNYDVAAFIRLTGSGAPPALLKLYQEYGPKDRLQLIVGDVLNPNDVDRAIETSDAVVSCMGAPRAMSAGANDFYVKTAHTLVESMIRNGTKRLVVVTAAQAKRMSKAWWDSNASVAENSARHLYWGGHYKHIAELEKYVEQNSKHIEYTFLRPSQLHDDSKSEKSVAEVDNFFIGGSPLARPALAKLIVDCVVGKKYVNKGVALAGPEEI